MITYSFNRVPPESWPSDCVTLTLCYPETMQRLRFQTNWFANWFLANMQTTSGENRSIQINATLYSPQRIEVHPCSYLTQFVLWKFVGLVDSTKMHSFYFAILCNQIAFSFDIRYVLIIVSKHWQSLVLSFSNVFRKRFLLMPSFFQVLDTKTTQLNQKKKKDK